MVTEIRAGIWAGLALVSGAVLHAAQAVDNWVDAEYRSAVIAWISEVGPLSLEVD